MNAVEHWIKYKDSIINIAQLRGFRVERWRPPRKDEGISPSYAGDLKPS